MLRGIEFTGGFGDGEFCLGAGQGQQEGSAHLSVSEDGAGCFDVWAYLMSLTSVVLLMYLMSLVSLMALMCTMSLLALDIHHVFGVDSVSDVSDVSDTFEVIDVSDTFEVFDVSHAFEVFDVSDTVDARRISGLSEVSDVFLRPLMPGRHTGRQADSRQVPPQPHSCCYFFAPSTADT